MSWFLVDGVEQLETYFGRYPQLFVAALTPFLIFVFAVYLDWLVALVLTVSALITLVAPMTFHAIDKKTRSRAPNLTRHSLLTSSIPSRIGDAKSLRPIDA